MNTLNSLSTNATALNFRTSFLCRQSWCCCFRADDVVKKWSCRATIWGKLNKCPSSPSIRSPLEKALPRLLLNLKWAPRALIRGFTVIKECTEASYFLLCHLSEHRKRNKSPKYKRSLAIDSAWLRPSYMWKKKMETGFAATNGVAIRVNCNARTA